MEAALLIAAGYVPRVQGGEPLTGLSPLLVECDGVQMLVDHGRRAAPGLRLEASDGRTALVATRTREDAERLFRDATRYVKEHLGTGLRPGEERE